MVDSQLPPPNEDIEFVRVAARAMGEQMSEGAKALLSEIGSLGRWLTASLLAVNGAAAAAVFGAFDKLPCGRVFSALHRSVTSEG